MGRIVKKVTGNKLELILNDGHHLSITLIGNRRMILKVFKIGLFGLNKMDIQVWHLTSHKPQEENSLLGDLMDRDGLLTATGIATGSCLTVKDFEDYMSRMNDTNWTAKRLS